jgi:hypothetical protein
VDEGRPLAEGLQDHSANRLMLLHAKACGSERSGKGRRLTCQVMLNEVERK